MKRIISFLLAVAASLSLAGAQTVYRLNSDDIVESSFWTASNANRTVSGLSNATQRLPFSIMPNGLATNLFSGPGTTGLVTSTTANTNDFYRGDGTWQPVTTQSLWPLAAITNAGGLTALSTNNGISLTNVPTTAIPGLGSIALQNSNNVTITGGTVSNLNFLGAGGVFITNGGIYRQRTNGVDISSTNVDSLSRPNFAMAHNQAAGVATLTGNSYGSFFNVGRNSGSGISVAINEHGGVFFGNQNVDPGAHVLRSDFFCGRSISNTAGGAHVVLGYSTLIDTAGGQGCFALGSGGVRIQSGAGSGLIGYNSFNGGGNITVSNKGALVLGFGRDWGATRHALADGSIVLGASGSDQLAQSGGIMLATGVGSGVGGYVTGVQTNQATAVGSWAVGQLVTSTNAFSLAFGSNLTTRADNSVRVNLLDANAARINGGAVVSNILSTTALLDTGSLAADSETNLTVSLTGATNGWAAHVSEVGAPTVGFDLRATATNNTIVVRIRNNTAGALQFSNTVRVIGVGF